MELDPDVKEFLEEYEHSDESVKFLGMCFAVFMAMPVNALRAMGLTAKFINDHKQAKEKTRSTRLDKLRKQIAEYHKKHKMPDCLQQEDKGLTQDQQRTVVRPKSPNLAYRTPAVPADTVYAMVQPKLGDNCCGTQRKVKRAKDHNLESLHCTKPSKRQPHPQSEGGM